MAMIKPGRPAPLPMSNTFCFGGMCLSMVSQSRMSNNIISSFDERPTILCALLNFKISFIKASMVSLVVMSFLI